MHCNLRPPKPRQAFSVIITTPCQVQSRWTHPLPYYSVFFRWYITLRRDLDLWSCNLSSWTFAVYCLCIDDTLYQIWTQSRYPRWSYCDFNIWPNDLEHVTCCARLWDNFHQVWPSTTYPCLNYSVFYADTLCHAVTPDSWPTDQQVHQVSRDQILWESVRNLSKTEQSPTELFIIFARYVMLWPWPLTSWPWTFTAPWVSCV